MGCGSVFPMRAPVRAPIAKHSPERPLPPSRSLKPERLKQSGAPASKPRGDHASSGLPTRDSPLAKPAARARSLRCSWPCCSPSRPPPRHRHRRLRDRALRRRSCGRFRRRRSTCRRRRPSTFRCRRASTQPRRRLPLPIAMRVIYAPFYVTGLILRYGVYYVLVAPARGARPHARLRRRGRRRARSERRFTMKETSMSKTICCAGSAVALCAGLLAARRAGARARGRRGARLRAHAAAPELHRRRGLVPAARRRRLDAGAREHGARRGRRALHGAEREPRAPDRRARLRARRREHAARSHQPRAGFPAAPRDGRPRLARPAQPEGGPDARARHPECGLQRSSAAATTASRSTARPPPSPAGAAAAPP